MCKKIDDFIFRSDLYLEKPAFTRFFPIYIYVYVVERNIVVLPLTQIKYQLI